MRFKSIIGGKSLPPKIEKKKRILAIAMMLLTGMLFFPHEISSSPYPPGYHTYDEVAEELRRMSSEYSAIARLHVIGESVEGRTLYAIKISDNPELEEPDESDVLYIALHHAREVITMEVAMGWINFLLLGYERDSHVRELVDAREIWVVPALNPDGLVMVEDGNFDTRKNTHGVDINRNYGYRWGYDEVGSSRLKDDETYRGPFPFSEPETKAIKSLVESHSFVTAISWHSGYEAILYPWGYVKEHTPDNDLFFAMASWMGEKSGYPHGNAKDGIIYTVNGDLTDWLYGFHGVFGFTVEVYEGPSNDTWLFFNPPFSQLTQVVNKNMEPALLIAEAADNPKKAFVTLDFPKIIYDGGGKTVTFAGKVTNRSPRRENFSLTVESTLVTKVSPRSFELSPFQSTTVSMEVVPVRGGEEEVEISIFSKNDRNVENRTTLLLRSPDRKPPEIFGVEVSEITEIGATVTWETDEESLDTISYGTDGLTDSLEIPSSAFHVAHLRNLQPTSRYYYKIMSKDASGNTAESPLFQFFTADATSPGICCVRVEVENRRAIIEWETDESSSFVLTYGKGEDTGQTIEGEEEKTVHRVVLENLSYNTIYSFKIACEDESGNVSQTESADFKTPDIRIYAAILIFMVAIILLTAWQARRPA